MLLAFNHFIHINKTVFFSLLLYIICVQKASLKVLISINIIVIKHLFIKLPWSDISLLKRRVPPGKQRIKTSFISSVRHLMKEKMRYWIMKVYIIFTKPLVEEKNPQCSIFNVHKFFLAQMSFSDYPSICPSVCLVSCPEWIGQYQLNFKQSIRRFVFV